MCNKKLSGRVDKIFCSSYCKSDYHVKLRRVNKKATLQTDKILHRNRSILLEILGKHSKQKKVDRMILDDKKFNYSYITGYEINSQNKTFNYVYDFAWMAFSTKEILIRRMKSQ